MKQLALQSEAYRCIVRSFREWLATVGYSGQAVYQLPTTQELLYYAESKGYTGLWQLDNVLIRQHYERLKKRPNERRGGGLSNSYLNKHLEAYKRLADYLRQSGRLLLPPLDLIRRRRKTG
jgi:integrase/recombinase XerD